VTLALARCVRPGSCCVDVGANVGYYTALLADLVGPLGEVIAVEPNPRALDLLAETVVASGAAERTRIIPVAAGERAGTAELSWRAGRLGAGSLDMTDRGADRFSKVDVATLDSVLGGRRIGLLKIDAEGHDYRVIAGAMETLRRSPGCRVVMEHAEGMFGNGAAEARALAAAGFGLEHIDYDGVAKAVAVDDVLASPGRMWHLVWRVA